MGACLHCHGPLGSTRRFFCDDRCRSRAYRRRRAGLPQDAFPAGGRRGRVPLAEPTQAEKTVDLLTRLPRAA